MKYDIFYASKGNIPSDDWNKFHQKFPLSQKIENVKTLEDIKSRAFTKLFWVVWNDLEVIKDDIFEYTVPEWDEEYVHVFKNSDYFDGINIFPKHLRVTDKEFNNRFFLAKKEIDIVASVPLKYDIFSIESYNDYLRALESSRTEMFWMTSPNLDTSDFKFDLYFPKYNEYDRYENHAFIHRVDGKDYYNGVYLLSKHKPVTKKEIEHRYLIEKKEWAVVASGPVRYDIFDIETYDDYLKALETTKTEMFWMTSLKVDTSMFDFKIYFTHDQVYYRKENHSFIHRVDGKDYYNGIHLLTKHKPVTKKEIEHRYLIEKKEWDIVASGPIRYEVFEIETYNDYLTALEIAKTELFWMTSPNLNTDIFDFKMYFTHDDEYNRKENHAFIHRVDGRDYYNGVHLLSKHKPITKKEIEHRYLIEKKEWDVVASGPVRYDIFNIETYNDYLKALESSRSEMFWMTSQNLDTSDFKFDLYFTHDQTYNRKENHAFIHRVDGKDYYNGVFLLSKRKPVTKKEIEHRHLAEKKEWDVVASGPVRYDIFNIETYDDYLKALETTKTEMFWMIPSELKSRTDFSFDLYFTHDRQYDRNINHVFKNQIREDEVSFHGISLLSKNKKLSPKEVEYRYLIDKKEYDIVASDLSDQCHDIIFISYNESCADENFLKLQAKFPSVKRIDGVKGIHRAHREAAKLAESQMFWVVDADAEMLDEFEFRYNVPRHETDMVHVWSSKNPINDLVYGYGGIKLLPKNLTLNMDVNSPDMTTDISKKFKSISEVSNVTRFDTDPFNTWKSAFRECVKLASGTISRQDDAETKERLEIWCTQGRDKKFGKYAIEGAVDGKKFGEDNRGNLAELMKINNFEWLKEQFNAKFPD